MRVLPSLFLLTATLTLAAPPASACHVGDLSPVEVIVAGTTVSLAVDYSGCPHEPTLCFEAHRPSSGVGAFVCPYP